MSTHESRILELTEALEQEQKARQQAETELLSLKKTQQEYISLVAHELRIPMTAIQGYTDLLIKAIMGPVNETQLTFLKTIRSNVERMSRLVSDLSDINKIEGNRLQIKSESVALNPLVDRVSQDFTSIINDKALSLTTNIPENLPSIYCDVDRLYQVLANLLRNAIQYTPSGGKITINAAVQPEQAQCIEIKVVDTGIGIPADQQDQIFDKFFRSSDDETRQTSGNGLALHLSKLLLEMQNGLIHFISSRGSGSTFTVTLPIAKSS